MKILWVHKKDYEIDSHIELIKKYHSINIYDNYFLPFAGYYPNHDTFFDLIIADIWGAYDWSEYDYSVDSGIQLFNKIAAKIPFVIVYKDTIDLKLLEKLKRKNNTANLYFLRRPYAPAELLNITNTIGGSNGLINNYSQIIKNNTVLIKDFNTIYSELTKQLSRNPRLAYQIEPRKFEELIAYLLEQSGYKIELTKSSRDGGKDIYALQKTIIGDILAVIECKRYAKNNLVGIDVVQRLYGVKVAEKANMGMVITTSSFTKPAINFQKTIGTELSFKDYSDLMEWINATVKKI